MKKYFVMIFTVILLSLTTLTACSNVRVKDGLSNQIVGDSEIDRCIVTTRGFKGNFTYKSESCEVYITSDTQNTSGSLDNSDSTDNNDNSETIQE